jgi:hypothetical protein
MMGVSVRTMYKNRITTVGSTRHTVENEKIS